MFDFSVPDYLRHFIPAAQHYAAGDVRTPGSAIEVFLPQEDQPAWARRIAEYTRDRFRANCYLRGWSATRTFSGLGEGKRAVNWNYGLRFGDTYRISQITGNCVFASLGDVGITQIVAYLILAQQQPITWEGPGSASFYMFRGHAGQGASLASAALAHDKYGYAVRKVYCGGKYDLRQTRADQQFGIDNWRSQPADFLEETSRVRIGRVAELDAQTDAEAQDLCRDCLLAGGILHTGSTATAAQDGDPVSSGAGIGAHAQCCVGYDDTEEFRAEYQRLTGKRLTETVYFFDQTHGEKQYVRKNWMPQFHGRQTQGMFLLPWQYARRLIMSTCYLYWPDATGTPAGAVQWV